MKGIKFFTIGIGLGLTFSLGVNSAQFTMENFLIDQVYIQEKTFLAQVSRESLNNGNLPDFKVKARSALVIKISDDGEQTIIFDQNSGAKMPIASLTKLMTAVVSFDNQPFSQKIKVSRSMIPKEWSNGDLKIGEKIMVRELLKMALVESSNDAANILAEISGRKEFIEMMNLKVKEIGLRSTNFSTPTGLEMENNFSSARDMVNLTIFILNEYPLILDISAQPSVVVLSENGEPHHLAFNTNELLNSFGSIAGKKIVGGKTGYTDEAGGCIILVLEDNDGNYFVNVILGADSHESRFSEMKKLIETFN